MQNITPFLSDSTIKPELAHVYVHNGVAVATDSYRLVEIKLDELCISIPNGYYEPKKWIAMCKAYNKKNQDLYAFMVAVNENNIPTNIEKRKDYNYPEYKAIIPQEKDLKPFAGDMKFTTSFLQDFIEIVSSPNNSINFSNIQTDGKMLYYKTDTMKVLLMKHNK